MLFSERIAVESDIEPGRIAYVGDRLDNDILPVMQAGIWAVFIRRGPWGHLHALRTEAGVADARIDSLAELLPSPDRLAPRTS